MFFGMRWFSNHYFFGIRWISNRYFFGIRWFQRSELSQRAAPASRSAPTGPLVFRSAGDFFSSDYQQLCDFVFFLAMLFIALVHVELCDPALSNDHDHICGAVVLFYLLFTQVARENICN